MKNDLLALTDTVLAKSAAFATRIRRDFPAILCDVGHYSNGAFLLRSFVSLRGDNQGDELAMAIDVTNQPSSDSTTTVSVQCDLCMDDGTIVATGPGAKFDPSSATFEMDVLAWGAAFDEFLNESARDVSVVLNKMIATNDKVSIVPDAY